MVRAGYGLPRWGSGRQRPVPVAGWNPGLGHCGAGCWGQGANCSVDWTQGITLFFQGFPALQRVGPTSKQRKPPCEVGRQGPLLSCEVNSTGLTHDLHEACASSNPHKRNINILRSRCTVLLDLVLKLCRETKVNQGTIS